MTEPEKLIEEFSKLSFEDKKKKLILILEDLKWLRPTFDEVLDATKNNPNVDEEFLVWCYGDIMTLADNVQKSDRELKMNNIADTLKDKMKKLHDRENVERAQENPEDLLSNI